MEVGRLDGAAKIFQRRTDYLFVPAGTHLAHLDRGELRRRAFAGVAQRVLARAIEQEEAADDLLRLGERPVDQAALAVAHLDARALGNRAERVGGFQNPFRLQTFTELNHAVVSLMSLA